MRFLVAAILAAGLLSACGGLGPTGPFSNIEAQGGSVTPNTGTGGDSLVLDIRSPKGVGNAEVTLAPGQRPRNLVLRVHLKGLEDFRFGYGDTTVLTTVQTSGEGPISDRVHGGFTIKDGPPVIIDETDPHWMTVRVVGDSQSIPLDDGDYFEVEAPPDFLQGSERTFRLNWVDFYR
jgi:hypothetical protein